MRTQAEKRLRQPVLDVLKLLHRNRIDVGGSLFVVLEEKHHVKVFQAVLNPLKVDQLDFVHSNKKVRWFTEVNKTIRRGLHENVGAAGDTKEPKLPEGLIHFDQTLALLSC